MEDDYRQQCGYLVAGMSIPDNSIEACAQAALAADFDPVSWDEAPEWRRQAARAVARSALSTANPDQARMAWFTEMSQQGWRWDRVHDEKAKTSPGMVEGELTHGGTRHWVNVVDKVREVGRRAGARMTGL
jgi:hypothetical protein